MSGNGRRHPDGSQPARPQPAEAGRRAAEPSWWKNAAASGHWVHYVAALAFAASSGMPAIVNAAAYLDQGPVIGARWIVETGPDDSLFEIARRYDVGAGAMADANPGVDPFVPGAGRRVVVPTEWILPDVPVRRGIVVNTAEMRLYVFPRDGSGMIVTFPVGIGEEGWDTPLGHYTIIEKIRNPAWHVPASIRKEKPDLPAVVPPGPDNPMGSRALRLSSGSILIHGTNRPWGIGTRDSHGCIRLYEEDIAPLFETAGPGTRVTIVDQPVKVAADGDRIYVQVLDDHRGRDLYGEALKLLDAKRLAGRVDLQKVLKATRDGRGLVAEVSK